MLDRGLTNVPRGDGSHTAVGPRARSRILASPLTGLLQQGRGEPLVRDDQTVCLGQAASAAAVLLAAGTPGMRLALPNARVLIHQPALSGQQGGQASDIEIHANEVMRMREWTAQTLALHSGKTYEEVDRSIERDNILTAAAALEYGLVDKVLESRKLRKPATNTAISHT